MPAGMQVIMALLIFALLGSVTPEGDRTRADEVRNGLFSTIAFLLGAITSILSGYLGMKIATYANARTAVEARKGIAPAFMCGTLACRQ
jgi:inorganic pyrophosphatase